MKVFIAGSSGLVGSALVRKFNKISKYEVLTSKSSELDLRNTNAVFDFFAEHKPTVVIDAAAKVGGIHANATYPVEFLIENTEIQINLFSAAHKFHCEKLVFSLCSSSCVYPKDCPQPIKESFLLTGPLEITNQAYAIAKIAGMKLVESYRNQYQKKWISAMPTNLFGPNDNFSKTNGHVLPAMIRKFHDAKIKNEAVLLWGDGTAKREFLHVDDLADAIDFLIDHYDSDEAINIGAGKDITILELANLVSETVGYEGSIKWDTSKPNGTPQKLLDTSKINSLGWRPKISLVEGVSKTYDWFLAETNKNNSSIRL
ncbi:MAG: GDP-L-fucose synthase [Actinomycetota bacterium]|nr:GDP-L-fucose synthase [Actinomycetota bacterium]